MKLSILLSAYNGSNYVRQQLDSIIDQTFKPYEIILIDDCSKDNDKTWKIFQEYKGKFNNIKTYKNPTNFGYEKSFMNGLNIVTGDIVLFSDHDDIWHKNKLEIINDCFNNYKIDGLLSAIDYKIEVPKAGQFEKKNKVHHTNSLNMNKYKFDEHFIHTKGEACALAVSMNFVSKYKDLWVDHYAHDDFWECILSTFGKLAYYDGVLVTRRIHGNNETALKQKNINKILNYLNIRRTLCEKIINSSHIDELSNNKKQMIKKYIHFSDWRLKTLKNKDVKSWIKISKDNLSFYNNKAAWIRDLLWIIK